MRARVCAGGASLPDSSPWTWRAFSFAFLDGRRESAGLEFGCVDGSGKASTGSEDVRRSLDAKSVSVAAGGVNRNARDGLEGREYLAAWGRPGVVVAS